VGDIDVDAVEKMIKAKFADLKKPAVIKPRAKYKIPLSGKNQFIAVTDKEFQYTVAQVIIKHPGKELKTATDYRNSIKRNLFNQMLGERYNELSQAPDVPFIQGEAGIEGFLAGLEIYGATVVAKPGEFEKAFKAVWTETERAKKFGFTETELERAKQRYLTSMETALKEKDKTKSESLVKEYTRYFLNGEAAPGIAVEYKLVKQQLPGITLAEINLLTKQYITDSNRDIIIMSSEKEKDNLPGAEAVNNWIAAVQKDKITAFTDQVSDKPLLSVKPVAGKIVAEKNIPELNITELSLSNGVTVVLKPTDFKNDQVIFNSFSPGGSSLYSDEDYQSATNAAGIISSSGVGEFNAIQLPKVLTGKVVNVSPYISERSEGLRGSTNPKDLETAMQLTYLYFTEPRQDADIFKGIISRSISGIANRGNDPNSVFSDTVSAVLGNYNVRRTGPSISKLEQIKLDRAYAI
jgi:zinc protease